MRSAALRKSGFESGAGRSAFPKYVIGLLLFGSNGVAASGISLSSREIVLLRSVIGGLVLLALFLAMGGRFTVLRNRRDLGWIVLSGAAMAADWLFLFEAYDEIGVSLGMMINYCGPAIVIALSPLVLGERLTRPKVIALAAALAGSLLISGQGVRAGMSLWGLFCAGMSAIAYACMILADKKVRQVRGTENAVLQLLAAAAMVTAFALCCQGLKIQIDAGDWPAILWLAVINTGLGCFLYFSSIGDLPASTVAVCGYIEPLTAVLLAALLLGESMTLLQMFGAGLIIGGAVCGGLKKASA